MHPKNYYPYIPHPASFDPYKIELPSLQQLQQKYQYCHHQCISAGIRPGTQAWKKCMAGCGYMLTGLLEDRDFIEDIE